MEKVSHTRKEINRSWWYAPIRGMSYLAFKFWWAWLLFFTIAIAAWYWWCYMPYCESKSACCEVETFRTRINSAQQKLAECCDCTTPVPNAEEIVIDDEVEEIDDLRREYSGCVGDVTVTLRWSTKDDLDLHLMEPNGDSISFNTYKYPNISPYGGTLDVDKNAGTLVENPIENICYLNAPPPGVFTVKVHFFSRNSSEQEIPYQVLVQVGEETKVYQGVHRNVHEMHRICDFNPR